MNKIDLVKEEERKETEDKFIKFIENDFAKVNEIHKFNLNKENEIAINGKELNEKVSKFDSFEDYLNYYLNHSNKDEDTKDCYNFYEFIIQKMKKDFKKIKINIEEESDDDKDNKKIVKKMKMKDIENYDTLNNRFSNNANFNTFISKINYLQLKDIFKKNKNNYQIIKENDKENLIDLIRNKMKKIIDDYLNINKYIGIEKDVKQYLGIDSNKTKLEIQKKLQKMKKELSGIENPMKTIYNLGEKIYNIYAINENNKIVDSIYKEYISIKNYFENTSSIRFLMVGPHSSGKSTFLNRNIGYNHDYLSTSASECTKICVIIKYAKKNEEAKLYETKLEKNNNGYNYFRYTEEDIIAEGEKSIHEKINNLNNSPEAKKKLKYYLLKAPIEFLDMMNLKEEEKEKIELIDFPGLDTNFDNAKIEAKHLLSIIDGFIYINYRTSFPNDDHEIFKLIYTTISKRRNFSFDTCLFILNKMDQQQDKLDFNKIKDQILDTFQKQNMGLKSTEILEKNERIGDRALILTPFSCEHYKNYKIFEYNILNDFDTFILENVEKEKSKGFWSAIKENTIDKITNLIFNDDDIQHIKENLKNKYVKTKDIDKFYPDKNEFLFYLNRLKQLFIKYEKKEKDLEIIVKLFLYIKQNKEQCKIYGLSNIENLLNNYKLVINNTLLFFKKRQISDILDFFGRIYLDILKSFTIIKMRMNDENLENFEKIDRDRNELFNDIKIEADEKIKKIKTKIDIAKDKAVRNIKKCKNKDDFDKQVKENDELFTDLTKYLNQLCDKYKEHLKNENNKIIVEILKLKEYKEKEEEFKKKIRDFINASMRNNVAKNSNKYIELESHWYWFFGLYKKFKKEESINNYKSEIENFSSKIEEESIEIIENNKEKAIENIEEIINIFNIDISGYKGKIDLFKERIKELEEFIYNTLGIN